MKDERLLVHEQLPTGLISKYVNPNWQLARLHGKASSIGIADENNLNFCSCCFHHIQKHPIPISQDTKQLEFLGFGVPLYFAFVRNCIFLLIVTICTYNIQSIHYALVHNYQFCANTNLLVKNHTIATKTSGQNQTGVSTKPHHYQVLRHASLAQIQSLEPLPETQEEEISHEIECTGWMIYLSRIQKKVTMQQQLFRCASFFIHFILLVYIRDKLTKMKYYFDQRSLSPSDFAIFIKNLPPQIGQKKALSSMIKQKYGIEQIRDIILVPDLQKYLQLQTEKQQLISELQKKVEKHKSTNSQIQSIEIQIEENQRKIAQKISQLKSKYQKDELEAQRALLIFQTETQKWNLINAYKSVRNVDKKWGQIQINQASEPDEIIWENASYSSSQKKFFKFLGWFLSILTLIVITGIFIVLSHFKSKIVEQKIIQFQKNQQQKGHLFRQAFVIVMGMIFLVVLFNKFVLSHFFHKFTQIEKHSNTYKFQFYYCLKYCLGLFFTTALMTLIIQDFLFHNIFKHNFGVIEEETIMFLFNSVFVPLFWVVHPTLQFKKLKRCRKANSQYITQKQANFLMENPAYDVGKRYGQVLQIMWFTFLYLTIIPIGAIFSCLGLIAYYWVDKYNLLRRSTIKGLISGDLINLTLTMLQCSLILRVLGQILFDYQMREGICLSSWAYLAISVSYVLLPAEMLVNLLNQQNFLYQKLTYSQAEHLFKNTYLNDHILYNRLKEDKQLIYQRKVKSKQQRNQLTKNILKQQELSKKKQQAKFMQKI